MSRLLDARESNQQEPIYPKLKKAFFCGITLFNAVWKQRGKNKDKYTQFYGDLDAVKNDRITFE